MFRSDWRCPEAADAASHLLRQPSSCLEVSACLQEMDEPVMQYTNDWRAELHATLCAARCAKDIITAACSLQKGRKAKKTLAQLCTTCKATALPTKPISKAAAAKRKCLTRP